MKLYKFLNAENRGPCQAEFWAPPPHLNDDKGWVNAYGEIIPAHNGVHTLKPDYVVSFVLYWQAALISHLWEVEIDGDFVDHSGMIIARRARLVHKAKWDEMVIRSLCLDLIRELVPTWLEHYPRDTRLQHTIEALQSYLDGKLPFDEFRKVSYKCYIATAAPSGSTSSWINNYHKWRAIGLAAYRTSHVPDPGHSPTSILKLVLTPVLEAGLNLKTVKTLSLKYL